MHAEQKLLEKPGRVRAMPFRGACVRHGLDQLILRAQGRGAAFGLLADTEKSLHQILGEAAGIREK
jgi:hypothetical protein